MTPKTPFVDGSNNRDAHGRFRRGNSCGKGNPHMASVARWRLAIVESVSVDDIRATVLALVRAARDGEQWAIRELLDRCIGKPASFEQIELAERMDAIEEKLAHGHSTANRSG